MRGANIGTSQSAKEEYGTKTYARVELAMNAKPMPTFPQFKCVFPSMMKEIEGWIKGSKEKRTFLLLRRVESKRVKRTSSGDVTKPQVSVRTSHVCMLKLARFPTLPQSLRSSSILLSGARNSRNNRMASSTASEGPKVSLPSPDRVTELNASLDEIRDRVRSAVRE